MILSNQQIIKIRAVRSPMLYLIKRKQEQDAEVESFKNYGFITPQEYQEYKNGTLSFQDIENIHSDRMNGNYYYDYIEDSYYEGYLDYDNVMLAYQSYVFHEEGQVGFDEYMYEGYDYIVEEEGVEYTYHMPPLVYFLRIIYNNRASGSDPEPEPEE